MPLTIPFIRNDESKWSFNENSEAALATILSLADKENDAVDELAKVYYPFRVFKSEDDYFIFDLLGFSNHKKNLLMPRNIIELLSEKVNFDDADLEGLLEICRAAIGEPQYTTLTVDGLVTKNDLVNYIKWGKTEEKDVNAALFPPSFSKNEFSALRKQLQAVKKEASQRIELIEETSAKVKNLYDEIKKTQEKKYKEYKAESAEKIKKLEKEIDNSVKQIDNKCTEELEALNKEYDSRLSANQLEYEEVSNKLSNLKNAEGLDWETRKHRWDLESTLKKISKEKRLLEEGREITLSDTKNKAESDKSELKSKIQQELKEISNKEKFLLEKHSSALNNIVTLQEGITQTEAVLRQDFSYVSKLLELKYENGDTVHVPFYIYRSKDNFRYHAPIRVSESTSITKTLKLIFSESLNQKIGQNIEIDTLAFDPLMEKILAELNSDSDIATAYKGIITSQNMFNSRDAIDIIEVGLYQLLEWQWLSDKDYIAIQKHLIHKITTLNSGASSLAEPSDKMDTVEVLEVTA